MTTRNKDRGKAWEIWDVVKKINSFNSRPGFLAWVGNLKPQLGGKSGSPDDVRLPTL